MKGIPEGCEGVRGTKQRSLHINILYFNLYEASEAVKVTFEIPCSMLIYPIKNNDTPITLMQAPITSLNVTF